MKKSKKSVVGLVDIAMLSGGVLKTGSNVLSAKDVAYFKPITVPVSVFKTGSFGFVNG